MRRWTMILLLLCAVHRCIRDFLRGSTPWNTAYFPHWTREHSSSFKKGLEGKSSSNNELFLWRIYLILEDETKNIIVTVFSFPVIRHVLRVFANLNFPPTYRGAFGQNIYPWKRKIIIQDQEREKRSHGSSEFKNFRSSERWIIII